MMLQITYALDQGKVTLKDYFLPNTLGVVEVVMQHVHLHTQYLVSCLP